MLGTDLWAAGTHFYFKDYAWGALTLAFVGLPGFVCGLCVAVYGFTTKGFTPRRLLNYTLCILLGPFVYPIIQVLV